MSPWHLGQVSVLITPLCPGLVALASRGCASEQAVDRACKCRFVVGADAAGHGSRVRRARSVAPGRALSHDLIGAIFSGVNTMMNRPLTEDEIQREMQKGSHEPKALACPP